MKTRGYMYILVCSDDSFYTGSTRNLVKRVIEHQAGLGANHTKKRLPIELVYYEEFSRIDRAFNGEKQVQGWSRKKKEALVLGNSNNLPLLASCQNISHTIFKEAREKQEITPYIKQWAKSILLELNQIPTKED